MEGVLEIFKPNIQPTVSLIQQYFNDSLHVAPLVRKSAKNRELQKPQLFKATSKYHKNAKTEIRAVSLANTFSKFGILIVKQV